jgi:hypothetical protein
VPFFSLEINIIYNFKNSENKRKERKKKHKDMALRQLHESALGNIQYNSVLILAVRPGPVLFTGGYVFFSRKYDGFSNIFFYIKNYKFK